MANVVKLYYVDTGTTYKQWELLPNKLIVVDSISDYLASKSAMTINDFQYIKNDLEIGINVDLSQSYSQPKTTTSFKYVSIQNNGEAIHYYFVKKATWRSKTCVRFELVMDVLNTFKEGTDYVFKENTRIVREHKNRFKTYDVELLFTANEDYIYTEGSLNTNDVINLYGEQGGNTYLICSGKFIFYDDDKIRIKIDNTYSIDEVKDNLERGFNQFIVQKDASNYISFKLVSYIFYPKFMRKIDLVSEGINPVLNHSGNISITDNKTLLRQNWYLLYRNQEEPSDSLVNPVDCFLIPETATKVDSAYIENGRLIPSFIETGKFYYFAVEDKQATLSNGVNVDSSFPDDMGRRLLVVSKTNGKLHISYLYLNTGTPYIAQNEFEYDNIEYITFTNLPVKYIIKDSYIGTGNAATLYNLVDSMTLEFNNSGSYNEIDAITYLDRTDAKNIKLIKLPYCPYDFTQSGGKLEIAGSTIWEFASITQANSGVIHVLKLLNLSTKLEHYITTSNTPFEKLYLGALTPAKTDLRKPITDGLESKLFHSDFYNPTYVYDSFAFKIDLEKCDLDSYISSSHQYSTTIKFTMTRTINSKFMFTIEDYTSNIAESNFYKVLPIARNNEEVLYNVPYINYIRTGFNYDVKQKNLQNMSNYIGLGLSAASIGASLFLPSVPLKVAGVIASLVSMGMSIKNTIVSTISNENAIKQKQEQYKNQAASVVGSDDVDLMSEYCGNRLKYFVYKPTDLMLNLLNDLFFYAGYNSNRMGIPTHNNRINFDYLECEASIEKVASIPDECLNELINCFKAGVVYLHKTSRIGTAKWDWEQKYENWEANLFDE